MLVEKRGRRTWVSGERQKVFFVESIYGWYDARLKSFSRMGANYSELSARKSFQAEKYGSMSKKDYKLSDNLSQEGEILSTTRVAWKDNQTAGTSLGQTVVAESKKNISTKNIFSTL